MTMRFYDVAANEQKARFNHRAVVLACALGEGPRAFGEGLIMEYANSISRWGMMYLGSHSNALSAMSIAREQNTPITGSWDLSLKFWDPCAAASTLNANTDTTISTHALPEHVYHLDLINNTLVVGMASRLFHIYDIRKMGEPVQTRESSLKFMTRSLACMVDGKGGYAISSVEGRIGVEYFDPSPEVQDQKYAFKCHRQTIDDVDHVWPVNALAFHPVYDTFASVGSDGTVSIWDYKVKKQLRQHPKYSGPIPSVTFNCDGTRLAVGVSYTWDDGERPAVWVCRMGDEVKPRQG
ncbi:hypothetical protein SCLCIDRAFT_1147400 [Scleroderma citrinum Foug A]|uniref:Anaphase-promoting complex subunit 4 WD40 domain-containing protein n=1 Tax=Scleroderma citrinum Foug A TaxID=1036808 RepID=A0A0C2Z2R3_9AGAM|nr:hypothetical protein SCLCIDRAFT_1147400 [Scleroderma citrinum Foug A]